LHAGRVASISEYEAPSASTRITRARRASPPPPPQTDVVPMNSLSLADHRPAAPLLVAAYAFV
jgi:hypothetical protein